MDNSKRINLNHLNKSQINAGVNNLILNEQIETDTDIKKHGHNNTYILKNKNISNNIYNDMNNNTVNDNTDTIEKKKELNSVKENNLNYKFLLNNNNNIYVNNNIDSKSIDIENNSKDTNFYNSSMNPTSSEEYNKSSSDNDKVSKLNNTIVENEINGKNSNLYSKMKKNSCDYFNSINEENESNNNNNNTTVIVNNENGINNNVDGISNYYNCINKDLNNNINGNIVKEEKHIEKNYKVLNGNGYDTANAEDQWKDDKQKSEHKHKIVNETYNKVENNKSEIDLSNNNDSSNKNKDIINKEVLFENSNSLRDDFDDNNENENTSSYMSNSNVNFNNKDDTDNLNNDLNNKSNTFDINENKKKEKLSVQQYDASVKRRKIIVMEENENNQEEKISDAETKKMDTEKSESKSITNNSEKEKNSTEESALSKNNADSVERGTYLKDKLELLLTETKRYTEKLSGQRLKVNVQSKGNKTRRCALSEKEEDFMLLKEANEEDETIILKQPANINGVMKPYQIEGLNWLYQLYRFKINGILADEMGLGKTLQTISLLCYLRFNKNIKRKSIIICPRSTLDNWYEEIKKWCNELKAFKYYGNKDQRKELNKKVLHTDYDVLLTTYEIVIKDKSALYDIEWFFLIIDEAHRIKNEKSVLSSSVRFLKSENRLLLTGTPLHNNLKELWSLLNFLMPKIFDNSEEFDNLFNISKISTNDNKQSEIITQLHTILKPFMLRRLKVEVEQSLPPKREIYIFVGMSKLQKKLYSDILSKNIDVINAMTGSKNQMLNILMQLRKCCNHPYLFDGIEEPPYIEGNHLIETSGKMSLLDKLLPRLKKENSRVLLFSQMTRLLDIIDDYCRWKNYEYLRIDGSTPGDERQVRINQFNEPNSKYFIFLLSTRAGGIGINLTSADIVILFDSDYNPQMDIQAMDRAHRIGQKKRVIVYRFVTQNSVEEKIVERAAKKLKLDSLIIQKGKLNLSSNKENNKQELHDILNFGAPEVYKTQDVSSISDEDIDIILADAEKRTMEIENKLKNLENIFDLTNISLDGGLNMYNNLTKEDSSEETSDEEDSNSIEDSSTTNLDNNKKKKKN